MSFFDSLFGISNKEECPHIKFGRYSDNFKSPEKYKAWDQAEEDFESEKYHECIRNVVFYFQNESEDNIFIEENKEEVSFYFFQGSKRITAFTKGDKFFASAKIVKSSAINIGLMRMMLEKNYYLQYCSYSISDDNELILHFSSYLIDCSPFKIYYGLKELAINADKEDDVLLDEFKTLSPVDNEHLVGLTETEKGIKYQFIQDQIKRVFSVLDNSKLNFNELPISSSYLILGLIYKIDYLIRPEGFVMKTLDKAHYIYYTQNGYSVNKKNHKIRIELEKLIARDKSEVYNELYNVISTFSVNKPKSHLDLIAFIDGELSGYDWYYDNKHMEFAQGLTDFVVGYNLYNNTLPKVDRALFHLYYRVTNQALFEELGFEEEFVVDGKPNKSIIVSSLKEIVDQNKEIYPKLSIDYRILSYTDIPSFSKSLLLLIRTLDLFKPKNK